VRTDLQICARRNRTRQLPGMIGCAAIIASLENELAFEAGVFLLRKATAESDGILQCSGRHARAGSFPEISAAQHVMDNRVIAHEMQKARRQPPQTFTSAFLLPFGAPGDIPPCIRQRPFGIAADRQPLPLLVRALNVFANVGTVADVGNYVGTGMEGLPTRLGALPGAHRGRVQCAPGCCPAAPVGVAAAAELSGLLQRRRLSFWPYGAGCKPPTLQTAAHALQAAK
jgi:hypothetical protein